MTTSFPLGRLCQSSRTAKDIQESQRWYSEVVGLPHLYSFGPLAFFDCGGTRLMLTQHGEASPSESIQYLAVEDIVKTHDEFRGRGIEFINAPHRVHRHADGTEEWHAIFKDPEGRPLGIMAQARP